MKKIALLSAFVAALSLASCLKENPEITPSVKERVTFHALETKAVFGTPTGNSYPTLWTPNDTKVAVSYNYSGGSSPVSVGLTPDPESGGVSATFEAEIPNNLESYEFIAVSPAAVVKSWNSTNKTVNVEIPSSQTSTADSPDEAAMVLYSKTETFDSLPKDVNMDFHHFTGYLHLVFKNYQSALSDAGATVQSVSITSAKDIAGRFFFCPEDGSKTVNSRAKTISVATESLEHVWVAMAPVDLSSEKLTFIVTTDKGTMTKEITLPDIRNLTSGKIAKISLNMDGIDLEDPVSYNLVTDAAQLNVGDQIIIVVANAPMALSTTQNSNNRASTSVVKGEDVILDPSAAVEVITLEDGVVPGEFALKTSDGGYLYAAGGDSANYLKTAAANEITPATAPLGSFDIQIKNEQSNGKEGAGLHEPAEGTTDNVAWIQAKQVPRGIIFYNGIKHASNKLFSCYAGMDYYTSYLHIYRRPAEVANHFKPAMPGADSEGNITAPASGGELTVNVFSNVAWTASGTAASMLDQTSGTGNAVLTLTLPQNTGSSDLNYNLVISTTAEVTPNSYTFSITQLAPVSGGASVGNKLWEEWWEGGSKDQTPTEYQNSGEATTRVYESGTVTYSLGSGDSTSKLKADGLVYLVNYKGTSKPSDYLTSDKINNLLLMSNSGAFKVTGIPCPGVKTAVLTYKSNTYPTTGRNITVTTDTENVSASTLTYVSKSNTYTYSGSEQTKTYYEITCTVSFDVTFSGTTFNLQFNNGYSSNIRITDMKLEVTEVY